MKNSIVLIVLLVTGSLFANTDKKEFDVKNLNFIKVKIPSGDVSISVSKSNKAYVVAEKVNFGKNCEMEIEKEGNDLEIEVEKNGWFLKPECKVNFDIQVPKEIAIKMKSGSGNVKIRGTKGEINLKIGSGNADINAEVLKLKGKLGSGSLSADGLEGDVDIAAGSGDITITYKKEIAKANINIKTGSGNSTIFLPSSMKIISDFKVGSGKLYNEFGDSESASFKISAKAGSGNLRIKKLK